MDSSELPTWEGKQTIEKIEKELGSKSLVTTFSMSNNPQSSITETAEPKKIELSLEEVSEWHMKSSELWNTIVSNASKRVPSTREEAILLDKWIDCEILRLKTEKVTRKVYYKEIQKIIGKAFHEVIRQVTSSCTERGKVLTHLWMLYVLIFEVYFVKLLLLY